MADLALWMLRLEAQSAEHARGAETEDSWRAGQTFALPERAVDGIARGLDD